MWSHPSIVNEKIDYRTHTQNYREEKPVNLTLFQTLIYIWKIGLRTEQKLQKWTFWLQHVDLHEKLGLRSKLWKSSAWCLFTIYVLIKNINVLIFFLKMHYPTKLILLIKTTLSPEQYCFDLRQFFWPILGTVVKNTKHEKVLPGVYQQLIHH